MMAGPWIRDWIWASVVVALSVLSLGLGVSDESEGGDEFSEEWKWFEGNIIV